MRIGSAYLKKDCDTIFFSRLNNNCFQRIKTNNSEYALFIVQRNAVTFQLSNYCMS